MPQPSDKAELRKQLLAARLAIPESEWRERSRKVCEAIARHPLFRAKSRIALYKSFRQEVDLGALAVLAPGKSFYFPLSDLDSGAMAFHEVKDGEPFAKNRWGLEEPAGGRLLTSPEDTLIIVPALAFDLNGQRLGYGKGFYDRFLAAFPASTLGACFAEFLLPKLPSEAHDQLVDAIVTDKACVDVTAKGPC